MGFQSMRYYFHLRIGHTVSPDEIGLDLPDVETAYLEAFKAAQELWSELLAEGSDPLTRCFEITDERGQLLLTLPFAEVLEQARKGATLPRLRQSKAELEKRRALTASLRQNVKTVRETIEAAQKAAERTTEMLRRKR
jgi:hypothetical protein